MKTVPPQAPLPGIVRQRQDLLDIGDGVMETGVETGDLRQVRKLPQQDLDGIQRKGLVQWGQWDIALQVGQHLGIDSRRLEVPGTAMPDAWIDHDEEPFRFVRGRACGRGGPRQAVVDRLR